LKKIIAFIFLALFVFNLVGFKLVYYVLVKNADKQFVILVDNKQFEIHDLVEIKIPNPLPYTKASVNYERIVGEISFANQVYKYVYRKVSPGFITILCLPDVNKNKLTKAENKFERIVYNTSSDTKNNKQTTAKIKANGSDYDYIKFEFCFKNPICLIDKKIIQHNFNPKLQPQKVAYLPPKYC